MAIIISKELQSANLGLQRKANYIYLHTFTQPSSSPVATSRSDMTCKLLSDELEITQEKLPINILIAVNREITEGDWFWGREGLK